MLASHMAAIGAVRRSREGGRERYEDGACSAASGDVVRSMAHCGLALVQTAARTNNAARSAGVRACVCAYARASQASRRRRLGVRTRGGSALAVSTLTLTTPSQYTGTERDL